MIMINVENKALCNGCHACYNACPKKCITMKADTEGFLYPQIDTESCVQCGKCDKVCPLQNGRTENPNSQQVGYAAYNKDLNVRLKSSSGGVFTLLAEEILRNDGIVVGAAMSDDCKSVHHIIVNDIEGLEKLRGSKYLQSTISDVLQQTKTALDDGKTVLFTGTPCQIGGLYSYLGKEYPNLYTQDLICHGVPSPMVWRKYVDYREKSSGSSAKRILFRNKKYGWKRYSVLFDFTNNTEYQMEWGSDTFIKGFLWNFYLRSSCYSCAFKTEKRQADITLADFWGIQDVLPDIDDDKGTSFVWIHSDKGMKMFDAIKDKMKYQEIDPQKAIQFNPSAVSSVVPFQRRKEFFRDLEAIDFEGVIQKYTRIPIWRRARSFVGRKIRKIIK